MERTYEFPVLAFVVETKPQRRRAARLPRKSKHPLSDDETAATGWATVVIRDLDRRTVLDLVLQLDGLAALVERDGQRHLVRLTGIRSRSVEPAPDGTDVIVLVTVEWRESE